MVTPNCKPALVPDDKRHGTNAGHVAGCREECCKRAKLRYDKRRRYELEVLGQPRRVPATGFKRRAQALNAIGWPVRRLADEMGVSLGTFSSRMYRAEYVYYRTHVKMAELYERLCMQPRTGAMAERTKRMAKESGYLPPLAWDDIDNDPTPTTPTVDKVKVELVDQVKVDRVCAGWVEDCNRAERIAVIDQWTGTAAELERLTGWHVWRTAGKRKKAA